MHCAERDVRPHRHQFEIHHPADAVFGVLAHLAHLGALLRLQRGQQPAHQVTRQVLCQVGLFVDVQRFDRFEQVFVAHFLDQAVPDRLGNLHQRLAALAVAHQPPQRHTFILRQRFQQVRQVGGVHVVQQAGDFRRLVQQFALAEGVLIPWPAENAVDQFLIVQQQSENALAVFSDFFDVMGCG